MKQISHINEIKTFKDLAIMLNVKTGYLAKIISNKNRYKNFEIQKKNGGERNIYAPNKELMAIQIRLKVLFEKNFKPHHRSYGFVREKDFILNAKNHTGKKYILNLDLENFFESISSKRVNNMFQRYFKVNSRIATILTHICCHPNGFLPQGAPTSPIISNIICKSLDKELYNLVRTMKLTNYSRYADDITFSTNNKFSESLIGASEFIISDKLKAIINSHGFKINPQKTRLQSKFMHQEVTGITVNQKLNINRRYIKKIRAILFNLKKEYKNPEIQLELFCETNNVPFKDIDAAKYKVLNILKGRIIFVAQVKGWEDEVFLRLKENFNELIELYDVRMRPIKRKHDVRDFYKNNTFVIDSLSTVGAIFLTSDGIVENHYCNQGTGFYLKDVGVVTNYHVIKPIVEDTSNRDGKFNKEYYLDIYIEKNGEQISINSKIDSYDKIKDIAILEIDPSTSIEDMQGFKYNERFNENNKIKLLGFPRHRIGSEVRVEKGIINRKIKDYYCSKYEISQARIIAGNSGGPIINEKNEVIGVASIGEANGEIMPSQFIPIKHVLELSQKKVATT